MPVDLREGLVEAGRQDCSDLHSWGPGVRPGDSRGEGMLSIHDVFDEFEKVGCCTFATVDEDGVPHSRIAHFVACDDEGLYLTTMTVKPYYRQLTGAGLLAVSGEYNEGDVEWNEDHMPHFHPGVMMRVTGQVRQLTPE